MFATVVLTRMFVLGSREQNHLSVAQGGAALHRDWWERQRTTAEAHLDKSRNGTQLFRDGNQDVEWTAPSAIEVSDDVLGVVSLAVAGMGIGQSYDFIVREHLAQGRLVEVLPGLRGRSRPFSVLYAPHRRQSGAIRAMVDVLTAPRDAA
jgi:DNA-binding transcriptional LysR family regulator